MGFNTEISIISKYEKALTGSSPHVKLPWENDPENLVSQRHTHFSMKWTLICIGKATRGEDQFSDENSSRDIQPSGRRMNLQSNRGKGFKTEDSSANKFLQSSEQRKRSILELTGFYDNKYIMTVVLCRKGLIALGQGVEMDKTMELYENEIL